MAMIKSEFEAFDNKTASLLKFKETKTK